MFKLNFSKRNYEDFKDENKDEDIQDLRFNHYYLRKFC